MYPIRNQLDKDDVEEGDYFPNEFTTERLRFVGPLRDYYQISEFHDFIMNGKSAEKMAKYNYYQSNEGLDKTIENWDYINDKWSNCEAAYYGIELLDEETMDDFEYSFIGWGDLEFDWELGRAELGVSIHPEFWGRGFSGERAEALVDLAFWYDGINIVDVFPSPENKNSVSAVEKYVSKMGGERVGTVKNKYYIEGEGVKDAVVFQITEKQFEDNLPL